MNFINNSINELNIKQSTLKKEISFSGVGIHNGKAVSMTVAPADSNTGIIFERTDIEFNNTIKATIENVDRTSLCTKIKNKNGVSVSTIEHLMATFNGLNIDNAKIKINAPELPALDGSAQGYINKIISNGIRLQSEDRKFLRILKNIKINDNDRLISIKPSNNLNINVSINYPETIIGNSQFKYYHSPENFIKDISEARTFTLIEDIEKMRIAGYAMGGNIDNAIVVDKYNILNPCGLRFEQEFVKHKTLDCIGDFYLLGMPLIGSVTCSAPGHRLNQMFIQEILKDKSNYKIETLKTVNKADNYLNMLSNHNYSKKEVSVA